MKMAFTVIYLLLFVCFTSLYASAQVLDVRVNSEQLQGVVFFQYCIVTRGNLNTYTSPDFNGLTLVSGPNKVRDIAFINGRISPQNTLVWSLVAQKKGKYTIGQSMVTLDSLCYDTQPIVVKAEKGLASPESWPIKTQNNIRRECNRFLYNCIIRP